MMTTLCPLLKVKHFYFIIQIWALHILPSFLFLSVSLLCQFFMGIVIRKADVENLTLPFLDLCL